MAFALGMNLALVILNFFQDPLLIIDGGLFGEMDPEPKVSEAKQVQDDVGY